MTSNTSDVNDAKSPTLTVHLRPRFSSCFTSLLQDARCDGALPLFPVLDDDGISDDDSEATDFSPMPLDLSESLDF